MSNPWCTAPSDVALTPFNRVIQEIEQNKKGCRNNSQASSLFLSNLRTVDTWLTNRRQLDFQKQAVHLQPELKDALQVDHLTTQFNLLIVDFADLSKSDTLKNSFINAFRTSQIIWDDISQENKAKLVSSLRLGVSEIMKIIRTKMQSHESFKVHEKTLMVLIDRTNVFDEQKEFDDYFLEDLYDLLAECSNSLELIRHTLVP